MERIRINSSVTKLKSVYKELQKLGQDISIQNNIGYLVDPIENLWDEYDHNLQKMDVLYMSKEKHIEDIQHFVSDFSAENFEEFLDNGKASVASETATIRIYDEDNFPAKSAQSLPSLVKILICNPEEYEEEDLLYFSQRFAKESVLLVVKSSDVDLQKKLKTTLRKLAWKTMIIEDKETWDILKEKTLTTTGLTNLIGLNINYKKICKALEATINNEYKDLSARKIAVQNDLMQLKKMGNTRVGQELFSGLKLNLQRSYSEFENGIQNRFEKLTRNKSGSMYTYIMDQIDAISDLEKVKSNGETKYFISKRVLADLEDKTNQAFHEHLGGDVVSLNDYFQVTIEEIDSLFKKEGLEGFDLLLDTLSNREVVKQLEDQFVFEKEFDSKSNSKGVMSYFSKARAPIMMLAMLTSTLAIFWEPDDKDTIRDIPQFKFLAGAAVIGGIVYLVVSTKKEQEKTQSEELKKAKQWLKAEYKRIFTTIEKEWKANYFEFSKNRLAEILAQAENSLKNYQITKATSVSTKTNLTQRKIQKLEAFDKKLKESKRKKAQIEATISSIESDLKQTFIKLEI